MTFEEQALEIARALDSKKGTDIRIFDVRGVSGLTDYYVVATGTAAPHLKALVNEVGRRLKDCGVDSYRTSGDPDSGWIVVDYVNVVLHVFSPEARAYYAIEKLWDKAKPVPFTPAD